MSSAEIRGYREMDFAGRDDVMNNPLRYQMTEYDCGPTSMLNAVSYLFRREEIPPEIVVASCFTAWTVLERMAPVVDAVRPAWL